MGDKPAALFLYSELSGYFLAAAECLASRHNLDVHIVRWPVNQDAPFVFTDTGWAAVYDRSSLDVTGLLAIVQATSPRFVYVSGWADRGYCTVARRAKAKGINVVCGLDTQWRGTVAQRLQTVVGGPVLRRFFTHLWVAGAPQYPLARHLGFAADRILSGVYTADVPRFEAARRAAQPYKEAAYPHNLLYVGRLAEEKGVADLCEAFRRLKTRDATNGWRLQLVGSGPLLDTMQPLDGIQVQPFVQNTTTLVRDAGAFVLPSRREPWGVVLHEFAAAGLPLVASDACGARTQFLKQSNNGSAFRAGDVDQLSQVLEWLFHQPDDELRTMGARSHELALQLTPESWASKAVALMDSASR